MRSHSVYSWAASVMTGEATSIGKVLFDCFSSSLLISRAAWGFSHSLQEVDSRSLISASKLMDDNKSLTEFKTSLDRFPLETHFHLSVHHYSRVWEVNSIQLCQKNKQKNKKTKTEFDFVVVLLLASSFWRSTPRLPTTSWRCGMGRRRMRCPWRRWVARCCQKGFTPPSTWSPSSSRPTFTSPSPASPSTSPVSTSTRWWLLLPNLHNPAISGDQL